MVNREILTLDEFTIREMRAFPKATGELSGLLRDIGLAAKRVNVEVNKAGLVDILGDTGDVNVQGEEVKKWMNLPTTNLRACCAMALAVPELPAKN
jgi:fructose-1,6-bisphosphatase I